MTQISRDDVLKLARLSNLQLTDDEIETLGADIGRILEYVEQLSELDTEGVQPAYQVNGLENILRDDIATNSSVSREELLALAPQTSGSHVKVPKVL